jgi:hypothetical protein
LAAAAVTAFWAKALGMYAKVAEKATDRVAMRKNVFMGLENR